MTNEILYIDDHALEIRMLKDSLKKENITPIIHWLEFISQGKELLEANVNDFDMVIIDINGTSLDFPKEIKTIQHKNIVVTSGIFEISLKDEFNFVLKQDLAKHIKEFYKE